MANISDLDNTLLSGLNHIDALLDRGPDWNYMSSAGNTLRYTFSVTSGTETGNTDIAAGSLQAFSAAQQANARLAMAYLSSVTGIVFAETATGTAADIHFCNANITGSNTTGLCSWRTTYFPDGAQFTGYSADAYVYLDNVEFASANGNLTAGGQGYETLLHEVGHALGLKHPFEDNIVLPFAQDNTAYTLMSYTHSGGNRSVYSPYDLAALNWIYGRDGLGGALGINSTGGGRYITGTALADALTGTPANDTLRGDGGNDVINGGNGTDTAVFSGTRATVKFSESGALITATGADGTDTLSSIELFQFSDGTYTRAQLLIDSIAPVAPTQNVARNAAGYVTGSTPALFGIGEAGATIKVFSGATLLGTTVVDANGFFSATLSPLANGSYTVFSTATDAAGNVSGASASLSFNVDATPPAVPTAVVTPPGSGNQAVFSGTGEAGSTISLINTGNIVLGQTTVGAGGAWSIGPPALPNGAYSVTVQSSDIADNTTNASAPLAFSINSTLNRTGTAGRDTLTTSAGNNALDGGAGIDTAVYTGARAGYTIAKFIAGFTVTGDGSDALYNMERITFADTAVALDIAGNGGQAYRLYRAAFDRVPDKGGVGFWIDVMDKGLSLQAVAAYFLISDEFKSTYGSNLTTPQFIDELYDNVLHRVRDGAGFDFWVEAIDARGASRADVLAAFSESAENQAQVIGSIQNGFDYTLWTG
jgi:serralysin